MYNEIYQKPERELKNFEQDLDANETADIATKRIGSKTTDTNPPQQMSQPNFEDFTVVFRYKIQENDLRPDGYFEQQISKIINSANLPAGSVGVPYEHVVDFTSIADIVKIVRSVPNLNFGNRGFAVTSEGNKLTISGTPRETIDSNLWFCFCRDDKKAGQDKYSYLWRPRPFLINPHPRDLWQNLPVADYEGYENKDFDTRGEKVDYVPAKQRMFPTKPAKSFEVIAASQRGRSHAHVGKPRDDCFYFEFDEKTGWNFIAVADGAGSAKFSRKGSEIACHTVIASLRTNLSSEFNNILSGWIKEINDTLQKRQGNHELLMFSCDKEINTDKFSNIFHNAVYAAYMAIHEEAQKRRAEMKNYHTTLLCAAFKYIENLKCWLIVSYWVGDGGAAILRWNGTDGVFVPGEPDGGEFAGQTKFLTMKDEITAEAIHKRLRFSFCETFESMIFVTDGITDPFFPSESAVGDGQRWIEFYEQKLKNGCEEEPNGCPELFDKTKTPQQKSESLLRWLDFWSKGNHDDRTILIVKNTN